MARLRIDLVECGSAASDFGDDVLGSGLPDEGFGIGVPVGRPGGDGFAEFGDAGEGSAAQTLVGELFEPSLDQVQPRTLGRGRMHVPTATILVRQPLRDLRSGMCRQIVQYNVYRKPSVGRRWCRAGRRPIRRPGCGGITLADSDFGDRGSGELQQTVKCSTDAHADRPCGCGWCGNPET